MTAALWFHFITSGLSLFCQHRYYVCHHCFITGVCVCVWVCVGVCGGADRVRSKVLSCSSPAVASNHTHRFARLAPRWDEQTHPVP